MSNVYFAGLLDITANL